MNLLPLWGFLIIILIMVLLMRSKMSPIAAFVIIPTVIAFCAGFSANQIGKFVKAGLDSTATMAALFIFSITFFGIMSDAGMFDKIIGGLAKKAGDNVIAVAVLTCVIAMCAHLDGSGAATFLITIPAMLPIYKRLHMRRTSLLLICTAAMGVMNLLPWGGPTARAAAVIKMDSGALWHILMPMQIVGLIAALVVAVIVALQEIKRGAGKNTETVQEEAEEQIIEEKSKTDTDSLKRPKLFWFNLVLTLAVIVVLMFNKFPIYFPFMIGTVIALVVNYPDLKLQNDVFKKHSPAAIMMAATILSAGVMLGVLQKSGMMDAMATTLVNVIPTSFGPHIAALFGVISAPLVFVFSTDAYYYGILPIIVSFAGKYGISATSVAVTMVACRNACEFISPLIPATFLGCGLAHVEIKDHIKRCFFWQWGISLVMLIAGAIFGIIPL